MRAFLGITTSELRRRFPFDLAMQRFVTMMLEPYGEILRVFHPLAGNKAEMSEGERRRALAAGG